MSGRAHDDGVEEIDLQELTSAVEFAADFDVGLRGRGIAARVIVHEDDGRSAGDNSGAEDFARMDKDLSQCADCNEAVAFDLATHV